MPRSEGLYFAFGSNLDAEQMRRRCPGAVVVGPAVLPDHVLVFGGHSVTWGGGVATVIPAPGQQVEGLLYRLAPSDLEALDAAEGHPFVYRRHRPIVLRGRRRLRAHTYLLPLDGLASNPPAATYLAVLERAYEAHGFATEALHAAVAVARRVRFRVFVYGTLLRGEANHGLLEAHRARFVGPAQTAGRFQLFNLGPYPALVAGGDGAPVVGEVYEVDADGLAALDRLEGHPRFYHRALLELDGGGTAPAYFMRADQVVGWPVIASGSWVHREWRRAR